MYVPARTPKYRCSACSNKIPVVDLEAVFYEELKSYFLSPEEIANQLAKIDQAVGEKDELLRVLCQEREKTAREVERVYRLYADDGLSAEGFAKFYRPLEQRQQELDEEIPRLQATVDLLRINHLSGDKIITEAKDLYTRWPELDRTAKRSIVESITDSIVIGTGEISITLCYLPSSEEISTEQRTVPDSLPGRDGRAFPGPPRAGQRQVPGAAGRSAAGSPPTHRASRPTT
jgi:site-specific DNA recombinase